MSQKTIEDFRSLTTIKPSNIDWKESVSIQHILSSIFRNKDFMNDQLIKYNEMITVWIFFLSLSSFLHQLILVNI